MLKNLVLCASAGLPLTAGGVMSARADLVHAVTQQQILVTWDSSSPGTLLSATPIQGLQPNELVMGMDSRGSDGQLYILGSFNRLYRLDKDSASASQIGSELSTPPGGANFGFDFNPATERLRVVSNTNANYSINPDDGSMVVATSLSYAVGDVNFGANPNVVHSAYTATTLYGIDTGLDILVMQNNGTGLMTTVGSTGADIGELGGFDIFGNTGRAYVVGRDVQSSRSTFYSVNLGTGHFTSIGEIAGGDVIVAMTVTPTPGTATIALLGGLVAFKRRR